MSTSHISRRLMRRSALALAVSAICLPSSALAQGDTKADYPGSAAPLAKVGDTPADFPGMPGSPAADAPGTGDAQQASGFDWTSAAIGAGGAGLLIIVSVGGASAASHMRMRAVGS